MKKIIFLLMLIVSALTAKAQHNVITNPSDTYQYEHFQGMYYDTTPFFERAIYTGQSQYLDMSFYNRDSQPVTLFVVIKDANDNNVVTNDILTVYPNQISRRVEGIAPYSVIGYSWDTSIRVDYPTLYDFEAYWIYRGRF